MSTDDGCVAAAILAGGRARRFGEIDKSGLPFGGVPIIDRLLDVLRRVSPHVFAVGDRYGAAEAAGLRVFGDDVPDAGALGGICTALNHSPCERTLVVGCDMPFLTEAFLNHLVRRSEAVPSSQPLAVVPRTERGLEPLCAIYTRAAAPPILARLQRGEREAAMATEGVQLIEVGPEEIAEYDPHGLLFVNVNTPDDYAQARRLIRRAESPSD